jgi:hypothetical protein
LTEYLFNEGWADRKDFEERESWQDNAWAFRLFSIISN